VFFCIREGNPRQADLRFFPAKIEQLTVSIYSPFWIGFLMGCREVMTRYHTESNGIYWLIMFMSLGLHY